MLSASRLPRALYVCGCVWVCVQREYIIAGRPGTLYTVLFLLGIVCLTASKRQAGHPAYCMGCPIPRICKSYAAVVSSLRRRAARYHVIFAEYRSIQAGSHFSTDSRHPCLETPSVQNDMRSLSLLRPEHEYWGVGGFILYTC